MYLKCIHLSEYCRSKGQVRYSIEQTQTQQQINQSIKQTNKTHTHTQNTPQIKDI